MRLDHDGAAIEAPGGRYERGHRRKSSGRGRAATVISPPAAFVTIRDMRMNRYGRL
jgi:hypothetical protein